MVAFYRSKIFNDELRALRAERDKAQKAGDRQRAAELESIGANLQELAHRQLAGEANLDNILAHLDLPRLAKQAGVDRIEEAPPTGRGLGRAPLARSDSMESVDVTDLIVKQFPPATKGDTMASKPKVTVRREGGKVWIEGVEKVLVGRETDHKNSVMASLTVALRAVGEDVTYDYLMGVSGAAFRLQVGQPDWCASAPFAGEGFNCITPAMRAVGRTLTGFGAKEGDAQAENKRREAIVASIAKGYPALFMKEEAGIIVGYVDNGKAFLRDYYLDRTADYFQFDKWDWAGAEIIGEKGQAPPRRESLLRSLEIAVEIANAKRYEDLASGFAAHEAWIAGLLEDPRFEKLDKEKLRTTTIANAWCYSSLVDARAMAARYLLSIAGEFEAKSAPHLAKAADIYEQIHLKLKDGLDCAPFPWDLKEGKLWTKEMRQTQARILKEALALEKKAVEEIQAALTVEKRGPK